jgi:hypothetical protein
MSRRRQPLVCQYIENLSSAALEEYADIIRDIVGRRHGVYALYRREKLYYVGLATNLRIRLNAHLKDRHRGLWDRFSVYLTIEDSHLRELESLVIRIAQPKGNRQRGKFARSENLTRTLRRRLREQQKAEWLTLIGREMHLIESDENRPRRRPGRGRKGDGPVLAGYVTKAMTLRSIYKGEMYKARVRRDGTIRVGNKVVNSPSLAAVAVVKRPVNGWSFWKYERAPGQWVKLRELRRR